MFVLPLWAVSLIVASERAWRPRLNRTGRERLVGSLATAAWYSLEPAFSLFFVEVVRARLVSRAQVARRARARIVDASRDAEFAARMP